MRSLVRFAGFALVLAALLSPPPSLACCQPHALTNSPTAHCSMMPGGDSALTVHACSRQSSCCRIAVPTGKSSVLFQFRASSLRELISHVASFTLGDASAKVNPSPPTRASSNSFQRVQAVLCSFLI